MFVCVVVVVYVLMFPPECRVGIHVERGRLNWDIITGSRSVTRCESCP